MILPPLSMDLGLLMISMVLSIFGELVEIHLVCGETLLNCVESPSPPLLPSLVRLSPRPGASSRHSQHVVDLANKVTIHQATMMKMQAARMQQLHDDHINDASNEVKPCCSASGSTPDAPSAQALWGSQSVHTEPDSRWGAWLIGLTSLGSIRPGVWTPTAKASFCSPQRPPSTTPDRSPFWSLAHLLGAGGGNSSSVPAGRTLQRRCHSKTAHTTGPRRPSPYRVLASIAGTGAPNPQTKKHSNLLADDQPHRRSQSSGAAHDGRCRPPHLAADPPQHGSDGWRPHSA